MSCHVAGTTKLRVIKAYDSHCNLVLGDVEETIFISEEDEDEEEVVRVSIILHNSSVSELISLQTVKKQSEMLFVRGK